MRIAFFAATVICLASTVSAQDGNTGGDTGGTQIGGETTDTEIETRGVETGRIENRESAFDAQEESAFTIDDQGQVIRRSFSEVGNRSITSGGATSTQRQVRPRFRLGFVPSASLMARSRQRAVSSFNTIVPRVRTLSGVSIMPQDNGSVTITGRANTRYDQLLAAAIARIQPGVRRVTNDVQVAPTSSSSQVSPTFAPQQRPQVLLPQPVQNPPEIISNPTPVPLQPSAPVQPSAQPQGSVIINPPVPPPVNNTPGR